MSERITEQRLVDIVAENEESYYGPGAVTDLVAEVRRLRALIVPFIDIGYEGLESIGADAEENLLDEARAIRDEQEPFVDQGPATITVGWHPQAEPIPTLRIAGIEADAGGVKRIYINGKSFVPEA